MLWVPVSAVPGVWVYTRSMLLEFYGKECSHCMTMEPLIERLSKEAGLQIERFEVWHDNANRLKMEEYDKDLCGGVPFFYNTETKKFICGETSYDALKAWAEGT